MTFLITWHIPERIDFVVPRIRSFVLLFLFAFTILGRNKADCSIVPTENPIPDSLFVPVELLNIKVPDRFPSYNYDVEMLKAPNFKRANEFIASKTLSKRHDLTLPIPYEQLKNQPFIWPIIGKISSGYGFRLNGGQGRVHEGIDIPAPRGTSIMATRGGVVKRADSVLRGYGNLIIIDHGNGLETRYAHCSAFAVKKGDIVSAGQVIAYVGNSGRSTADHLHFEVVINGLAYNPLRFLGEYNSALISRLTK